MFGLGRQLEEMANYLKIEMTKSTIWSITTMIIIDILSTFTRNTCKMQVNEALTMMPKLRNCLQI